MLLRQEMTDGVQVLSVEGEIGDREAGPLLDAVSSALADRPRAVVLDLHSVSGVSEAARGALATLPRLPDGWPLASLVVCPPATSMEIAPSVVVAHDRDDALAHATERRARPRTRIELDHDVRGPGQARAAVHACADRLRLDGVRDDIVLLVSEMVTNAIRHASPPVRLEIAAGDSDVVVAVCDGSPVQPAPRDPGEDAEGGRGMLLVDLLADDHGVRTDPPGKAVWARLRRPDASA